MEEGQFLCVFSTDENKIFLDEVKAFIFVTIEILFIIAFRPFTQVYLQFLQVSIYLIREMSTYQARR